jgi:hypothetical protein
MSEHLSFACPVCGAGYYSHGAAEGCCGLPRVFAEVEQR